MKLSSRDKKILIFMGIVIILALGYYFLYTPLSKRWREVTEQLSQREVQLRDARAAAGMAEKLEQDCLRARIRLKFVKERLPKEEGLPKLLKDIYRMGRESGVDILSFVPGTLQPKEYYKIKPISLSLRCNLSSLIRFLYQVEQSDRLLDIQSMIITSDERGSLNVSLQLVTFVYVE